MIGQAGWGLVIFVGVFFLGYGACYFLHVRPLKEHNRWLNARLAEEHRSRMELYDQLEPAGVPIVVSSVNLGEEEGAG